MKTLEYLNDKAITLGHEGALEALTEELGIKVTYNEHYDLYVLNYSQIDSPKTHSIVTECRSLVIEYIRELNIFNVVSRSFDRFLNLSENGNEEKIDITKMTAYEKLDGSLLGLFYHNGEWLVRTKSMIMPDETMYVDAFGNTWKDLIEQALGNNYLTEIDGRMKSFFKTKTLILELTSPLNRVVKRYEDTNATLLAVRDNNTGEYLKLIDALNKTAINCNWKVPKEYNFNTLEDCKEAVEALEDLDEGFVLYDEDGVPRAKLKNSLYLCVHRIRGETTPTPKRIMDLVFTNEVDEYLAYFKEDEYLFEPYVSAYNQLIWSFEQSWSKFEDIEDQKEFALAVKDYPFASLLFQKRKNKNLKFKEMFSKLNNKAKYRMCEVYLND